MYFIFFFCIPRVFLSRIKPFALAFEKKANSLQSLPLWDQEPHFWFSFSFNLNWGTLCLLKLGYLLQWPFLQSPCYLPKQSKITSFLAGSVTVLLSRMSASTCRNNWALLLLIAFVLQCISMDISYFHVVGQLFWLHSYLALWFC